MSLKKDHYCIHLYLKSFASQVFVFFHEKRGFTLLFVCFFFLFSISSILHTVPGCFSFILLPLAAFKHPPTQSCNSWPEHIHIETVQIIDWTTTLTPAAAVKFKMYFCGDKMYIFHIEM